MLGSNCEIVQFMNYAVFTLFIKWTSGLSRCPFREMVKFLKNCKIKHTE